ncbi:PH domain-containing protein [Tessaracoccus sp. MC1865]|uniref:PH domain-containing protein n=1 Tax=Tessaracoccus sp. MC1865 TaxID=2760310 RepID=UPI0016012569|nr:PH domain-containing protein [Tessaracoccus sp. MC1865]MBB1484145.1 PH domain-containing protein [Tessaracoccus sp. MC1865]QTO37172.1 PH domain-containing protein [Tessaracoccus sp. MC1865]
MTHGPDFLPPLPPPDPADRVEAAGPVGVPSLDPPSLVPHDVAPVPQPGPTAFPPPHPFEPQAPRAKIIERPHPLTGLARGGIALVAGGYFLTREILEGSSGFGSSALFIGGGLLLVALIAGVSGIFTWRTTTFIADDDEFRVERRFLSETSTKVDYTKVQSVEVSQPLIARLMGLAKVHIDVGGAGGVDLAFLSRGRAESMREHLVARMRRAHTPVAAPRYPADVAPTLGGRPPAQLPQAGEDLVVAVPAGNLLLGALVSLGTGAAVVGGGILVVFALLAQTPVTMLAAALGIGGWIWNQTGRNWNFRMTRSDGALRLTRGALSTTSQGLRPNRIQGVAIKQDLLQRATGLYQMTVTVLGYGDPSGDENRQTNAVVLPYGTWDDVLTVLRALWPEVDLTQVQAHPQPERARWLTPFNFSSHTWGIGEHVVVTQHGLLERVISIVPHRRMQSASIHQGPLQRRLRLAHVHVHTTDGPVTQKLYHLDEADARRVFDEQVARARMARATA